MTVNLDEIDVECVDDEQVAVFTLNGVTYMAPKHPSAAVALRYLDHVAQHGEEQSVPYLMELMLGREGYEALMAHDGLQDHQLAAVFTICAELALGAIEDPKAD